VLWVWRWKGRPLEVMAETSDWRRVRGPDGATAWAHKRGLDGRLTVMRVKPGATPVCRFRRFSQVVGSLAREPGGTGLGLAIGKGIVEAMGGEIGVFSAPGAGARFWFELPAEPAVLARGPSGGLDDPLAQCRILLADDNTINREEGKTGTLCNTKEDTRTSNESGCAGHGDGGGESHGNWLCQ